MSDSGGSPQPDNRHHRRSRPRSPVSPEYAGETFAEREKRRLAEAVVPVRPPARQHRAAFEDPEPPDQEPEPAGEAAPAAQAAAPAAPPPEEAPDAHGAETAAPASRVAASSTPSARGTGPTQAPSASLAAASAAAEGRESAKYRVHSKPSNTCTSPPKSYPPKVAFPQGRPRTVRPPAPKRMPPGITLLQLQQQRDARRLIQEGGDGAQAGQGASQTSVGRGAEGDRGSAQGRTQGMGQGAHGKKRGQGHGKGSRASGSRGGQAHVARQSTGSGRRDTGHSAAQRQGHGKNAGASSSARGPPRPAAAGRTGRARALAAGGDTTKDMGRDMGGTRAQRNWQGRG